MTLFDLDDKYNLDELERDILNYLCNNINDIKHIGVRKVAKDNFTSTATIYKLVKKLGFDGYADMVHSIHYDYTQSKTESSTEPYANILKYINPIKDEFLNTLTQYKDKQIVITGMGFSQPVADYICESLFLKGFKASSKLHMQLLETTNDDILLIIISKSGDTTRLLEIASKAKANNIKTICITGSKRNKLSDICSLPIKLSKNSKLNSRNGFFFGECIIAFELLTSNL